MMHTFLLSQLLCAVKDRVEWKSLELSRGDWEFWCGCFYFIFPEFRLSSEIKEQARRTTVEICQQQGLSRSPGDAVSYLTAACLYIL